MLRSIGDPSNLKLKPQKDTSVSTEGQQKYQALDCQAEDAHTL